MARSVAWRRTCSDNVSWRQDQALNATIYILRETGPTGFLIKEEGENKKFRVFLGDPHTCTCSVYMKEKDLCKHICWVLLKKFRVSRQNPASWQLGLVEREINETIDSLRRPRNRTNQSRRNVERRPESISQKESMGDGREALEQRKIGEDDVCPICQDELLAKHLPVTYCKYGCGNSIHIKCMKVWADHQLNTGEKVIKCPFCREDFGPISLLREEAKNNYSISSTKHYGASCQNCNCSPIEGRCYKCTVCAEFYLCQSCFNTTYHNQHSFQFRQKTNQRWRPAQRGTGGALPAAVMNNLLGRNITDGDYDLLLQLDNQAANQPSNIPESVIMKFPQEKVRENSVLLQPGQQCCVCLRSYQVGQILRRLPCRHKFHQECIDNWLLHQHATCPIDGQVVWDPVTATTLEEEDRKRKARQRQTITQLGSDQASSTGVVLEIPGVGIIANTNHINTTSEAQQPRKGARVHPGHHNSLPVNFELSGISYNIAQDRIQRANSPLPHQRSSIIDRIPLRIRGRVSSVPSLQPVAPSIPTSNSSPDVTSLAIGTAGFNIGPTLMPHKPPSGVREHISHTDSDPESTRRRVKVQRPAQTTRKARSSSLTRGRSNSRERRNSAPQENSSDLYLGNHPSNVPVDLNSGAAIRSRIHRGTKSHHRHSSQTQQMPDNDIILAGSGLAGLNIADLIR